MELVVALYIFPDFITQHRHLKSTCWVICLFNKSMYFYFAFTYPRLASLPDSFESGFPGLLLSQFCNGRKTQLKIGEEWQVVAVHWKIWNTSAGVTWNGCNFLGKENKLVKKGQESLRGKSLNVFELTKRISLRCVKCFEACLGEGLYLPLGFGGYTAVAVWPMLLCPHSPANVALPCGGSGVSGHQHWICVSWKHPEHRVNGSQPALGAYLLLGMFPHPEIWVTPQPQIVLMKHLWYCLEGNWTKYLVLVPLSVDLPSDPAMTEGNTHLSREVCVSWAGWEWDMNLPLSQFQTPQLSQLLNLGTGHSFVLLVTSPSLFTLCIDALAQNFKNVKKLFTFLALCKKCFKKNPR